MVKYKRRWRNLCATLAIVVTAPAVAIVSSTPAEAVVWNCRTGFSTSGAWGTCTAGSGTYQVRVLCKNVITNASRVKAGNWVNLGQVSVASNCGAFEVFYGSPWISSS